MLGAGEGVQVNTRVKAELCLAYSVSRQVLDQFPQSSSCGNPGVSRSQWMFACFKIYYHFQENVQISWEDVKLSMTCPLSDSPAESLIAFLLILNSHISYLVSAEGTC